MAAYTPGRSTFTTRSHLWCSEPLHWHQQTCPAGPVDTQERNTRGLTLSRGAPGLTMPSASGPPLLGPSTHFSQQVPDTVLGLQKALTLPASEGQFSRLRLPGVTPETSSAYVERPYPAHRAKSMRGKLTCGCWKGTERKGN